MSALSLVMVHFYTPKYIISRIIFTYIVISKILEIFVYLKNKNALI